MTDSPVSDLSAARIALSRGDMLIAYDLSRSVLEDDPEDLEARYVMALSLARAGAAKQARVEAAELRRRVAESDSPAMRLREDADALLARLAKDDALAAEGADRVRRARDAAELYEAIADHYDRYYSCVNAASLWLIGGDRDRACTLATRTLALLSATPEDNDIYWRLATEAEAALVLADTDRARAALRASAALEPVDFGARAATRRQLRVVCAARGLPTDIADMLELPSVLHYCGHRINDDPDAFDGVAAEATGFLDQRNVGFAYGSLASGADIIVAELLLDRAVELHVVLPFDLAEFEEVSVAPAGSEWQARFRRCLDRATTVTLASDSAYGGDDSLFTYTSQIAMGHALNRAAFLDVEPEQLAVWDGLPSRGIAGTALDVATWTRSGGSGHVIKLAPRSAGKRDHSNASQQAREINAILFTDLRGFSVLRDEHFRTYVGVVLGALAQALDSYRTELLGYKVWGDAIHAVFADVSSAAHCALDLQRAISEIASSHTGLPFELAMRVGAHVGPVLRLPDPFTGELTFWGREITRAARIEPRTPVGEVYVTDAFAALLALEPSSGVRCEYVGRVTTAKDFETIPMYRLCYL